MLLFAKAIEDGVGRAEKDVDENEYIDLFSRHKHALYIQCLR